MKDYTIIWEDRWQSGSHWHCLTKKTFIRCDDLKKVWEKYPGTVYMFEGHIPTLGEEVIKVVEL